MSPLRRSARQYLVAPPQGGRRVVERVVVGRRLRQAGEKRRLLERQPARRNREVRLGGRLDPVGVVAVVDVVEIRVEDRVPRPGAGELDGETGLDDLALQRPLAGQVEVADQLLRDGRAALDDATGAHVRDQRAEDPLRVDATVLVEAPVLDRYRRLRHPRADRVARDRRPVLDGRQDADQIAVRAVDERAVCLGHGPQRAQVAARAEVDGAPRGGEREQREGSRDREDDEGAAPPLGRRFGSSAAAHVQTPSARSRLCARSRSSCSRRSAAASSEAAARTVSVAVPLRELT